MILYCSNVIAASKVVTSLFSKHRVTLDSHKEVAKRSKFIKRFQVSQSGLDGGVPPFSSSLCPQDMQDQQLQEGMQLPQWGLPAQPHLPHQAPPLQQRDSLWSKSSLTSNEGSDPSLGEMKPYLIDWLSNTTEDEQDNIVKYCINSVAHHIVNYFLS